LPLYKFIFSLDEWLVSTKLLVLLQTFQRATEKAIKMQAGAQINIWLISIQMASETKNQKRPKTNRIGPKTESSL